MRFYLLLPLAIAFLPMTAMQQITVKYQLQTENMFRDQACNLVNQFR